VICAASVPPDYLEEQRQFPHLTPFPTPVRLRHTPYRSSVPMREQPKLRILYTPLEKGHLPLLARGLTMNPFLVAFLLGVLIATGSFMLKGGLSHILKGIRFRRRLSEDIKMTVEAYWDHYPEIGGLLNKISSSEVEVAFIWDADVKRPEDLAMAATHLKPAEASQCARFCDALDRISEIRKEYNLAVRGMVLHDKSKEQYSKKATACLEDLRDHYLELISRGCACLTDLEHHRFIDLDLARYHEMAMSLSRQNQRRLESDTARPQMGAQEQSKETGPASATTSS
jgi:hypothetical protein